MAAVEDRNYEAALDIVDQILTIEPDSEYAVGARPLIEDRVFLTKQQRYTDMFRREHASTFTEVQEKRIPYSDILRYPEDWPDLTERRDRTVAEERGAEQEDAQLLAQLDDRQPKLDKVAAELERDAALAKAEDDIEVRYAQAALEVANAELLRAQAIEAKSPGGVTQQEIQKLRLAKHRDELQIDRSKLDMDSNVEAPAIVVQDAFSSGGAQRDQHAHLRNMVLASDVDYVSGIHSWRGGYQLDASWFRASSRC